MVTIDDEIREAREEESKREVVQPNYLKSNMVTMPLDEFMRLHNSAEELAKLLSVIFANLELRKYRDHGVGFNNDENVIAFIANNEPCVFQSVLANLEAMAEVENKE